VNATPAHEGVLPAEVAVGAFARWFGYQRYAVFSGPWLRWRLLPFGVAFGALGVVSAVASSALLRDTRAGIVLALLLVARLFAIAFAGPALAAWVRARSAQRPSAWAMSMAVVTGLAAALLVERFAIAPLERQIRPPVVYSTYTTRDGVGARPPEIVLPRPGDANGSGLVIAGQLQRTPLVVAVDLFGRALFCFLAGGGLALVAWFGERRRLERYLQAQALLTLQREKQQVDLRLGMLQSQVEPHFLFNTLAALRSLLRNDATRAEAMLDALVDYLRATIPKLRADANSTTTTVADQVDLCRRYLELMQLRMGDRLQFRIEAPEAVRALPFPPLLLISLVENAIKHGIEPRPGPGEVRIEALRHVDRLDLRVSDNGVGLKPGLGSGLGLTNIREQLRTRYGARAELDLRSADGGGVVATIRIPLTESDT
jgi:signal transduction histidine kinase